MPKNHTGAGHCSPEAIQLQQQDLVPAVELSSKEGIGGQERSSSTPGREKPFGVTCGSTWCPHAAAAVSPALGCCDTTGTAPSWLCSSGATATFLGAAPPAEEPRSTLTRSRGGRTGLCCSGSQAAPTLERKRIQGNNRAGGPGKS